MLDYFKLYACVEKEEWVDAHRIMGATSFLFGENKQRAHPIRKGDEAKRKYGEEKEGK